MRSSPALARAWSGRGQTAWRARPYLWDINTTTNWLLGAAPTSYHQVVVPGDAVTFNDVGSGMVTLNTSVAPASLLISNSAKNLHLQRQRKHFRSDRLAKARQRHRRPQLEQRQLCGQYCH